MKMPPRETLSLKLPKPSRSLGFLAVVAMLLLAAGLGLIYERLHELCKRTGGAPTWSARCIDIERPSAIIPPRGARKPNVR